MPRILSCEPHEIVAAAKICGRKMPG